jgi:hypothetical protein
MLPIYIPDRNDNRSYITSSIGSTYLNISSSGSYSMRIELYVEELDTTINTSQVGSYITKNTRYVNNSDEFLVPSLWNGTLEFIAEGATDWGGDFIIGEFTKNLGFVNSVFVELPNSNGGIRIGSWLRK